MRMRLAGTIVVALLPAAASAAISLYGGTLGRECFLAADSRAPGRDAVDVCTRALTDEQQSLNDRVATFVNRGIVRMQANALNAAIADFDQAIRSSPETAEAYVNKGIALLKLGNHEREAVQLLTMGLERNPSRPEVAYYTRGVANEELGATREAFEDYTKAAALKPGWAEPAAQLERFTVKKKATAGV